MSELASASFLSTCDVVPLIKLVPHIGFALNRAAPIDLAPYAQAFRLRRREGGDAA
jgi:hypothetical protein